MPQSNLTDTLRPAASPRPKPNPDRSPLERIVVFAATFRELPTDRREQLADRFDAVRDGLAERLLLHTCHRAELIAVVDDDVDADDLGVPSWRGADAVERVLTVTAGLDSAIAGEEQLLGQVRDAYREALDRGETGPFLNELLRRALRFGKRVRSAALPTGDHSLAERSLEWLEQAGVGQGHEVLVVGTGTVARQLATGLAARGVRTVIASRNVERAESLVAELRGSHRASTLGDALHAEHAWTAVALATRTADPVLQHDAGGLVVDLCAPAGVAPRLRTALGDRLLDLDALGAGARSTFTPRVEQRLRDELCDECDAYIAWLAERRNADGVATLRKHAADVTGRHLERLRHRADLRDDQLEAVAQMTRALVAELLHQPTVHLRRADDAEQEVRRVFGIGA
jgi:glutamyl-tRNA reductase